MTGTNCDLFTHKQSRSCLNHLVVYVAYYSRFIYEALMVRNPMVVTKKKKKKKKKITGVMISCFIFDLHTRRIVFHL
jgi:hypothetical protein